MRLDVRRAIAEVLYRVGWSLSWFDQHFFGHLFFERGRFVVNLSLYPLYNRILSKANALYERNGL